MKHNKRTSRTGKSLWTGRRDTVVRKKSHVAVIGSIWQAGHQSVSLSSSNPSTSGSAALVVLRSIRTPRLPIPVSLSILPSSVHFMTFYNILSFCLIFSA
ncbi:hypothetical protein ACMYSQ_001895 [Aspergillus niger]